MVSKNKGDIVVKISESTWLYHALFELAKFYGGTPQEMVRHLIRVNYYRMMEVKNSEQPRNIGEPDASERKASGGTKIYQS